MGGNRKKQRRKRLMTIIICLFLLVLIVNAGFFLKQAVLGTNSDAENATNPTQEQKTAVKDQTIDSIRVDVCSDHMMVLDLERNKAIFKKEVNGKTRPASLTKIMTALLVIEHTEDFQERVQIPHDISTYLNGAGIAVAGFQDGENPTVEDLLYGVLYKSGAECCLTLAEKVAGSEGAFVEMMNEKAGALNMKDTTFGNCIGLDNPACWTTVNDLMKLTKYALKNDHFRQIFASYSYTIEPTNKCDQQRTIVNGAIRRFGTDRAGVFGGKLGNTTQAQLCLASISQIGGKEFLCISTHAQPTEEQANPHVEDARAVYKEIARQLDVAL